MKGLGFRLSCLAVGWLSVSGCALFPKTQSVVDPTSLYVWPASSCPSTGLHAGVLGTSLGTILGTDAVGVFVNILGAALNSAAAADKNGYQISTNSAVFYDYVRPASTAIDASYSLASPQCYIVAIATPTKDAKPWCDDKSPFKKGSSKTCEQGQGQIEALSKRPDQVRNNSAAFPLAPPKFYAEILLQESPYSGSPPQAKVVVPTVVAMYYPRPLIGGAIENGKARHLTLTLTFSAPVLTSGGTGGATDYFKGAGIALDLLNITPGETIAAADLASNVHTTWTTVPVDSLPTDFRYKNDDGTKSLPGPYKPISVAASLHEVGDPNVFLQAFASSFGSQSSIAGITNALAAPIVPVSDATKATNEATYQNAQSKYLGAVSTYQVACVKLQSDRTDSTSHSSTAAKSAAAIPSDTTALAAALAGANGAYASWVAAQLQNPASGPAPVVTVLNCQ